MNQELKAYYSTVAELLKEEKHTDAYRIFTGGDVASFVVDHDNWDGGIDFYAVEITIDVKSFVTLRNRAVIEEVCGQIEAAFNDSMQNTADSVRSVTLIPSSTTTFDERKIAEPHVDIKPSKEWEVEIEKALFSMNALCAILTPDFNESSWCDQEVGYAFGRNVLTIPIDKGLLPYGMFGKIQAIKSDGKNAQQIAEGVFNAIVDNDKSRIEYTHMLMNLVLNSKSDQLINQ